MSRILELREKRAKLWESAKNYLETHRRDDGTVSAEDTAAYEKMETDVVNLGNEIARLERQKELDAEMIKVATNPILNAPESRATDKKSGRASESYNKAFWNAMLGKKVYNAIEGMEETAKGLEIGEDAQGGYLVPDEYERTLVQALEDQNIVRKLAKVITTASGDRKIPIVKTKGTAEWIDEGAEYKFSDDTFGQVTIGAHKLGTVIKVTEELLNDSAFNIENYIAGEFARRIGAAEEEAFIIGDGKNKPTGIFHKGDTEPTEADVTTKAAITFDDIMDLYYSLRTPYRNNAVWLMHEDTIKAIRKLKDGNGNYIWQPSVREGEPDKILNRPYYTSVFAPTDKEVEGKKARGIIAFGDFSYYWIADRQGRSFKRLNELYAITGQVGFLASQRVDGKLILPEAIKILATKTV